MGKIETFGLKLNFLLVLVNGLCLFFICVLDSNQLFHFGFGFSCYDLVIFMVFLFCFLVLWKMV